MIYIKNVGYNSLLVIPWIITFIFYLFVLFALLKEYHSNAHFDQFIATFRV